MIVALGHPESPGNIKCPESVISRVVEHRWDDGTRGCGLRGSGLRAQSSGVKGSSLRADAHVGQLARPHSAMSATADPMITNDELLVLLDGAQPSEKLITGRRRHLGPPNRAPAESNRTRLKQPGPSASNPHPAGEQQHPAAALPHDLRSASVVPQQAERRSDLT